MHVIIPMSGLGSRFVRDGYTMPKPLIKVDGKPMIEHVVNLFPNETKFTFICNDQHLRETSMEAILRNIVPTCTIREVSVENRQGPVDAVYQIRDMIDDEEEVIVSYCDYGTKWDYHGFLNFIRKKKADGAIAYYTGFHPHLLGPDNYAFMVTNSDDTLIQIREKEMYGLDKMTEKSSNGTYYFRTGAYLKTYFKKLMDSGVRVNNEFYVSMVYNHMVEDALNIQLFPIEKMLQWGTPRDLEIYKEWSGYFRKLKTETQTKPMDPLNTTLILPMAGHGSRFPYPKYRLPKPFLSVNGKPMVIEAVDQLPETTNKVFICLEQHNTQYAICNMLEERYDNTSCVTVNEVTKGQACTCELGILNKYVGLNTPILISACDNGVYYDVDAYQKMLMDEDVDVIVWGFKNNQASDVNPDMYAWLDVDDDGFINGVSCKKYPYDDDPRNHSAIIGTMFFRKAQYFMDGLQACYENDTMTNGEYYVDNVIQENIKSGLRVKVFNVDNYLCWGTPGDYETYKYWRDYF